MISVRRFVQVTVLFLIHPKFQLGVKDASDVRNRFNGLPNIRRLLVASSQLMKTVKTVPSDFESTITPS